MKLFAQIQDLTGLEDGLQGRVIGFATVASNAAELEALQNVGATVARSEAALRVLIGEEMWSYFVPAPNTHCAGWHYDNGTFTEVA